MAICTDCGGAVIEVDVAAGNAFCVACGTVVEENTIVSEVTFGETSSGAAMVQGSYVGQGSTRARLGGPFGNRGSMESREQTIANANRKIRSVANVLRLSEVIINAATRMYTLAVEHKFTRGRNSMGVVAVCLYVACRQKQTYSHMLIDFSDLLQVNVFELGHTYLQLVHTLNLRLPLVDPAHHIARFAALLEFGEETARVATDAVRLVQRFDRDWLARGRRPAGICGAALILASRMNNFRRSVEEVVQVVKIADSTLRKRLDEFKKTPSAQLTLADFRMVDLEEEMDPPAFVKGREKERRAEEARRVAEWGEDEGSEADGVDEQETEEQENGKEKGKKKKKKGKGKGKGKEKEAGKKRGKKRKRGLDDEMDDEPEDVEVGEEIEGVTGLAVGDSGSQRRVPIDPALLNTGILEGTIVSASRTAAPDVDPMHVGDPGPSSLAHRAAAAARSQSPGAQDGSQEYDAKYDDKDDEGTLLPFTSSGAFSPQLSYLEPGAHSPQLSYPEPDGSADPALHSEVSGILSESQGASLALALEEAETRRRAQFQAHIDALTSGITGPNGDGDGDGEEGEEDWITGLDEAELDRFILTEEEVHIKERVWVEINKDYLEAIALRVQTSTEPQQSKSRKRRKPAQKPRDASTPTGATVGESVRNLLQKSARYSRRINYNVLESILEADLQDGKDDDGKDDDSMYRMDDKSDGEGMEVVEEDGGGVGSHGQGGALRTKEKDGRGSKRTTPGSTTAGEGDGDGVGVGDGEAMDVEEGDDKADEYIGWEDAYEQEV